ncbi:hypothetical protein [Pedosphaera parvula]|uniref:Lipoprotein n=1 Tax=Pedosphaera parvula (strain Ellin514) TaxID=320771 RepID=B9XE76_PEDPL|nr:hypothetical protein [Pedosphaera parvula]EEF61967.1 hypothetical protein Cflav_PD4630 [Pedosphaera parvula Ellin514]
MKNLILVFSFVVIASAFVTGCEQKTSNSSAAGGQLTAADLAQLMDFHAWNVPIPQSQQPFKSIRLVIIKRDGTIVTKLFDTGSALDSEQPCTSIFLGFRVERGTFTGHLNTRDSKGGGIGWGLNFTDAFADSSPGWGTSGTAIWNGNHAELGLATKRGEMVYDNFLAIELVK